MNDSIFIFDNFYEDPSYIRKIALTFDYIHSAPKSWKYNQDTKLWPGLSTEICHLENSLDKKISNLLGKIVRSGSDSGFFRISLENDSSDYVVHTDGLPSAKKIYSGVCYLTPEKYFSNKIGTIFYKHKKTGKVKIDDTHDYMQTLHDLKNIEEWEIYRTVEYKYNRMILLENNLFHSIGDVFGDNKENGRLAQIFNFHEI
jgi:hypothetical protein